MISILLKVQFFAPILHPIRTHFDYVCKNNVKIYILYIVQKQDRVTTGYLI